MKSVVTKMFATSNASMSTKITMAFVAAVIAFVSPALAAASGNRENEYQSAQYCIPQVDSPDVQTTLYC